MSILSKYVRKVSRWGKRTLGKALTLAEQAEELYEKLPAPIKAKVLVALAKIASRLGAWFVRTEEEVWQKIYSVTNDEDLRDVLETIRSYIQAEIKHVS